MSNPRPVGGFLGLELPDRNGGLRRLWRARDERLGFANATSALAALIAKEAPGAVWLPAYICPEVARAAPADRLRYYPLDAELSPRVDFLLGRVDAGDLVVAVDFFGRAPSQGFLDYVAAHADILFVEDSAQAFDTGRPAWGDWRLFSPRKLVGVPDGGILVPCSARAAGATSPPLSVRESRSAIELAAPQLARFEDQSEADNNFWHALNQRKEAALAISNRRVSRLTWSILGLLDVDEIAEKRRRNFTTLASRLNPWALLHETRPEFVPLGFPVRLAPDRRPAVQAYLYRHRVFPAVHWPRLLSPPEEFAAAHALADNVLTLPCDQRYGEAEMQRVADLFLRSVS